MVGPPIIPVRAWTRKPRRSSGQSFDDSRVLPRIPHHTDELLGSHDRGVAHDDRRVDVHLCRLDAVYPFQGQLDYRDSVPGVGEDLKHEPFPRHSLPPAPSYIWI